MDAGVSGDWGLASKPLTCCVTSSRRMRPWRPEPATALRSAPSSLAKRRTEGEAYTPGPGPEVWGTGDGGDELACTGGGLGLAAGELAAVDEGGGGPFDGFCDNVIPRYTPVFMSLFHA